MGSLIHNTHTDIHVHLLHWTIWEWQKGTKLPCWNEGTMEGEKDVCHVENADDKTWNQSIDGVQCLFFSPPPPLPFFASKRLLRRNHFTTRKPDMLSTEIRFFPLENTVLSYYFNRSVTISIATAFNLTIKLVAQADEADCSTSRWSAQHNQRLCSANLMDHKC